MSADYWDICPKCVATAKGAIIKSAKEKARASYGKVSREEYERLRIMADGPESVNEEDFRTFREDYEFWGASDGVVHVDYSGECTVCSLSLHFAEEHPIPGLERDWAKHPPTQAEVDASAGKKIGEPGFIPLEVLMANNGDISEFSEDDLERLASLAQRLEYRPCKPGISVRFRYEARERKSIHVRTSGKPLHLSR